MKSERGSVWSRYQLESESYYLLEFVFVLAFFLLSYDYQNIINEALRLCGIVPGSVLHDRALSVRSPSDASRCRSAICGLVEAPIPSKASTTRYHVVVRTGFSFVRLVPSHYQTPVYVSGCSHLRDRLSTGHLIPQRSVTGQ